MWKAARGCFTAALFLASGIASAAETIKLGLIEPLSGPFSFQGNAGAHMFQMFIDEQNARGGVLGTKLEFFTYDNKGSPQESLIALKQAVDQGVRYIVQASGSHNAH